MIAAYRCTAGITTIRWLCGQCRAARERAGWTHEHLPAAAHPPWCDDCERRRQLAAQASGQVREWAPVYPGDGAYQAAPRVAEEDAAVQGGRGAGVRKVHPDVKQTVVEAVPGKGTSGLLFADPKRPTKV